MNHSNTPSNASSTLLSDLSASDKHCVFRSGTWWFSLPAVSVREITIAPNLVRVPQCRSSLAGLCHLRSEFVPVISLNALLDVAAPEGMPRQDKLMVVGGSSVWAMLIAEAAAIESLETIIAPEARMDDAIQNPVMGTAMYRDNIVRVLDPKAIFQMAQQALEDSWSRPRQLHHPSRCEQGSRH